MKQGREEGRKLWSDWSCKASIVIEFSFKELKSHYRLEELPTCKTHIAETLLFGAVITLLVGRRLLRAVQERLRRTSYKMPEQGWAAVFAAVAPSIFDIYLLPPRVSKVVARNVECGIAWA